MKNTIIYLLGFPGTGKYTIAKTICEADSGFKLVDNHLINIPLFSLIETNGSTPLPERIWENISKIWDAVLDTITHIAPKDYSFVLTNALTEQNPNDKLWFDRVKQGASKRGATFLPVRLLCSVEEMERRIIQPERAARMKETNPKSPQHNAENYEIFKPEHPETLTLDVSDLSPEEAAKIILSHAQQTQAANP